ncbi:hypothetical protein MBLNU230_g2650t1 [Neophaeotheca triangularis]
MSLSHVPNPIRFDRDAEVRAATCMRNLADWTAAVNEIVTWPEYAPQPLHRLSNYARKIGIDQLYVKDESKRFGTDLGSFKALGAPYAVFKILSNEVYKACGVRPTSAELRTSKYRDVTRKITVCVATDGNQGRGLAYGAKIFNCRCVTYIHSHVSEGRKTKMTDYGAIVIRIDGEYEASVSRAKEDARMNGWYFVSSTSWTDFDNDVAQHVMNAYMTVVHETISELPSLNEITHVFVCGGVGSIGAAIFQGFYTHLCAKGVETTSLPRFVLVEPSEADCLLQSARDGELRQSEGTLQTCMAGLACRTPSPAAWKMLRWLASDFIAVPDGYAHDGMRILASGSEGDVPLVVGESSAASIGILAEAEHSADLRGKLGLEVDSRAIVFGLEGVTDPDIYTQLVGRSSEGVFEAQEIFQRAA